MQTPNVNAQRLMSTSGNEANVPSRKRWAARILSLVLIGFWSWNLVVHAQEQSPASGEVQPVAEVPNGYEVGEKSVSPDGRYAFLYPVRDEANRGADYPPNLLVRLKPYSVLAKIGKSGVPQNARRGELVAEWNGNSAIAICERGKWGMVDLKVYEIENDKTKRVHLVFREARKYFDRDFRSRFLKKYPKEKGNITFVFEAGEPNAEPEFEFKGRKLLLNLAADNTPNLAPGPHWTAELHATWDLDTGRFEKVDFRPGPIGVRPEL